MKMPRYRWGARFYDILSAERPLYRRGRLTAIAMLDLRPGQRVLVVGCGTGLDLPYLVRAIGSAGEVVGVDASPAMLARARAKVRQSGWRNVCLINADAALLTGVGTGFDAVLFTYSLSVIEDWHGAWEGALGRLRPGGRVCVVDTDLPTGIACVLAPLAGFALWTGGVDRRRQVWRLAPSEGRPGVPHVEQIRHRELIHGHIHVAAGTVS